MAEITASGSPDRCITYGSHDEHIAYVIDTPSIGESPVERHLNKRCETIRHGLGKAFISMSDKLYD